MLLQWSLPNGLQFNSFIEIYSFSDVINIVTEITYNDLSMLSIEVMPIEYIPSTWAATDNRISEMYSWIW